jgi:hypothetical protein
MSFCVSIVRNIISGHTALLEDEIDVSSIMEMHGFSSTTHNTRIYHGESMRKDLERDENMDDMGKLIRPWRVCNQL